MKYLGITENIFIMSVWGKLLSYHEVKEVLNKWRDRICLRIGFNIVKMSLLRNSSTDAMQSQPKLQQIILWLSISWKAKDPE